MIVKFKVLMLAGAVLLLLVGVVLSAMGESRRRPGFLRACGVGITGVALGGLVALALAS